MSTTDTKLKPMESVKAKLRKALQSLDHEQAMTQVRGRLSAPEKSALIDDALRWLAWDIQRSKQLEIERAAAQRKAADDKAEALSAQEQAEQDWTRLYERPEDYYGKERDRDFWPDINNADGRKAFRQWCGRGGKDFAAWLARAKAAADPDSEFDGLGKLEMDWHPDGPMAALDERESKRVADMVRDLINAVAEETRLSVTAELLGSEFALGDGRRVTWGCATIDEHRQRIQLLQTNALANVDAAARHRMAIKMLEESGATCLEQITAK